MKIHLLAVGTRMPDWVKTGYAEYAGRLSQECLLNLVEIPTGKRGPKADVARLVRAEGERLLAAVPTGAYLIALDERGREWSTAELADRLAGWLREGRDLGLLIGGPDGLDAACRDRAEQLWSLSRLTLPHALVRVVVAEQLYRAWSLLRHHPYHRA
ncbi:MAG: 23S rRNA (pseudouridine(1915)-N(3))-methyltransferase RlmH [Gammaproteobacteria bacterium]|nr:23S rRNA (pseudouridine(1915)-N(3))-methyltransferase RlmH [Gammaproteobacteria bacterium]MCP5195679.1 23S rRNA (pseudouridine(1915)-N(3))-methyltransferase RlmH [Gammaproteobacteria bacterium]